MAPRVGVDSGDLASSGWGVIFSEETDPAIEEALAPLLELRREQAGDLFRILYHQPGEEKMGFLSRHGMGPGPADPERLPYYLLIVADPSDISFEFQTRLDIQYAVGRIYFETIEQFRHYAENVVAAERHPRFQEQNPRHATFFGVENPGDEATRKLRRELIEPLAKELAEKNNSHIEAFLGEAATREKLSDLLREDVPEFLLIGSHGLAFQDDSELQRSLQGALICSDWQGSVSGREPVPREYSFGGADVDPEMDLTGLILFAFACYSGGTPQFDTFDFDPRRRRLTDKPFVAQLPQSLLGKPQGALAFIGNVDRAWTLSWNLGPEGPQLGTYFSTITSILEGVRIGHAMEYFNHRYAELAAQLAEMFARHERGEDSSQGEIDPQVLWVAAKDAQNFVILGDPAVSLRSETGGYQSDAERSPDHRKAKKKTPRTKKGLQSGGAAKTSPSSEKKPARSSLGKTLVGSTPGAFTDVVSDLDPDYLRYTAYIESLADLISSRHTAPPVTIGIFGEWGVGKSFLLKGVCGELRNGGFAKGNKEEPAPVSIVEFNAWEYSAYSEIWPGLVRKIIQTMEDRLPRGRLGIWWSRVQRNFLRKLSLEKGRLVVVALLIGFAIGTTAILAEGKIELALSVMSLLVAGGFFKFFFDLVSNPLGSWMAGVFQIEAYGEKVGFMEEISADLRFLSRKMKDPDERILVVIDDLDRCEPNRAVEMLKAINLLLSFERFVVLLGIDSRLVTRAVEKHYEGLLGKAGASGREYLDKIIQIPFRIPPAEEEDIEFYLSRLMGRATPSSQEPTLPTTHSSSKESPGGEPPPDGQTMAIASKREQPTKSQKKPRPATSDVGSDLGTDFVDSQNRDFSMVDLSFSHLETQVFERLISHLRPNPRHIKRTLNIYRLVRAIAHRKQDQITLQHPQETALWVVLSLQWPQELDLILQKLQILEWEPDKELEETLGADPLATVFLSKIFSEQLKKDTVSESSRRLSWLLSDDKIPRPDFLSVQRLRKYAIHVWDSKR